MSENAPGPIDDPNAEDAVDLPEPTDDETPDGTQIPTGDELPDEEGDAGVDDSGTEEWYGTDDD